MAELIPFGIREAAENIEANKQRSKQVNATKTNDILVLEREGVLGVQQDDGRVVNWTGTREELHTYLAKKGYKRVGAARGSDIAGLYVRA